MMQSYGDVPLSVKIKTKNGRQITASTSLFDALNRTRGRSRNAAIRKALKYIEEH